MQFPKFYAPGELYFHLVAVGICWKWIWLYRKELHGVQKYGEAWRVL